MSKESDAKADVALRRRKRRMSGLRVPSDDVPRQEVKPEETPVLSPRLNSERAPTEKEDEHPDFDPAHRLNVGDLEEDTTQVIPIAELDSLVTESLPVVGTDSVPLAVDHRRATTESLTEIDIEEVESDYDYEVTVTVGSGESQTVRQLSPESEPAVARGSAPVIEAHSPQVEDSQRNKPTTTILSANQARNGSSGPPPAPQPKQWFEEIFNEDYLKTLPFLTPRVTQTEAAFVEESLNLPLGTQLLDLGCGYGRHAMELAGRGYHVVGLDLALPLLQRGAEEAQRRGLTISFVHQDMRNLAFDAQFDGAYCLFSTFGYFDDETNESVARKIAAVLRPGARFVIEVLNRDYLITDLPARVWWEGDGCVVLEEVQFDFCNSRIVSNRSVVFDDGRQLEAEISLRVYSLHELNRLLSVAGFRVLEISGSVATRGKFFGSQSRDIIVVAERQ